VWDGGNGRPGANGDSRGAGSATADFIRNIATAMPPLMDVMKNVAGIILCSCDIHLPCCSSILLDGARSDDIGVEMPDYFGKLASPEQMMEAAKAKAKADLNAAEAAAGGKVNASGTTTTTEAETISSTSSPSPSSQTAASLPSSSTPFVAPATERNRFTPPKHTQTKP
jgi:hypothetical protein